MTGRGNSSTVSLVVFSSTSVGHICQVSTLHFFSIFSRTPFTLLTTAARHPGLHFKPSPGTVRAFTDIHSCNFLPESLCSAFQPSKATSSHSWKCSPSPLHVLLGFIQNKILASHEILVSSDKCLESGCTDKGTLCCDGLLERGTEMIMVTPVTPVLHCTREQGAYFFRRPC